MESDLRARRRRGRPLCAALVAACCIWPLAARTAAQTATPPPGAVQGEFFTAATRAHFQLVLALIMDARMWAVIMDENPGAFEHDIDGAYPDGKTFATMPGLLLAQLPGLPDDIQYRFVGRHLILYDVRANTIIDRMPDAIRCIHCD